MTQRVDFSKNASIYDRRHGTVLSAEIARELALMGELPAGGTVLDIGAGTGRVAIPFASLGYKTLALDPSLPMLKELRRKSPDGKIHAIVAEAERLPFPRVSALLGARHENGFFDAVILARILYLISDWQKVLEQAYDVLTPGGSLFHEWGNGRADEE